MRPPERRRALRIFDGANSLFADLSPWAGIATNGGGIVETSRTGAIDLHRSRLTAPTAGNGSAMTQTRTCPASQTAATPRHV